MDCVDELDLPAIKRRPKRTIKPIQDKKTELVKFVDSDASTDDESDSEWVQEAEGSDVAEESDCSVESDGSYDTDDESDTDCVDDDKEPAICNIYTPNNEQNEEEDEETKVPIMITKEDMPFLFEERAPGKRQIKVIQYKNEIAEKAAEMSSEESSEDEDWQAKQDDIKEQIMQDEDEEDVDLSNVPIIDKTTGEPEKTKTASEKTKPKISHEDALDLSICCVCLTGSEEDNVLECDYCGVTVHEGCYGHPPTDPDNDDIDVTWFCEPCIADVDPINLHCEMCPDKTGVMKATDTGKWAHLVCALYTDGIGFGDTTLLEPIITTDIPPHRWGYRKCDLCEDTRFMFNGLVAECDAGMCRSRFHISCAQKLGYLMENTSGDTKEDPFFAYCKVHVDKDVARWNKKVYQSLQEHYKAFKSNGVRDEILELLEAKRQEYSEKRKFITIPAVMTEKHPRAVFGSTSAFAKLTRKAEMFGLDTHVTIIEDSEFVDKPMKAIKPEMTVEFAQQYQAREKHIKLAVGRYKHQNIKLMEMREEEHKLQANIDILQKDLPKITKKYEKLRKQAVAIWKFLSKVDSSKYLVPECLLEKQKIAIKTDVIKRKMGLQYCHICKHGENPETMVDCDQCNNWYHFSCLDPPVSKNPKVNKSWAWFCTPCTIKQGEETHNIKEIIDDKTLQPTTKFGRSVKRPDHYKDEDHKQEIKHKPIESPKKHVPEGVLLYESPHSLTSQCHKCSKSDSNQKICCSKCTKSYHLYCITGSYDADNFICNQCHIPSFSPKKPKLNILDDVPKLKPELMLPKVELSEALKNASRKNIFELQYNLLQKRKRQVTFSQSDKEDNLDESLNKSSDIEEPEHTDTDDEIDANDMSIEDKHHSANALSCNKSLISNIISSNIFKDIQNAVAKVPDDSMVKLGVSPIKNKPKILHQENIPPAETCQVNVDIQATSEQTVLMIQQSDILHQKGQKDSKVLAPVIISAGSSFEENDNSSTHTTFKSNLQISQDNITPTIIPVEPPVNVNEPSVSANEKSDVAVAKVADTTTSTEKPNIQISQDSIIPDILTPTIIAVEPSSTKNCDISVSKSAENITCVSDTTTAIEMSNIQICQDRFSTEQLTPTPILVQPSVSVNKPDEAVTQVLDTPSGVEISISSSDIVMSLGASNIIEQSVYFNPTIISTEYESNKNFDAKLEENVETSISKTSCGVEISISSNSIQEDCDLNSSEDQAAKHTEEDKPIDYHEPVKFSFIKKKPSKSPIKKLPNAMVKSEKIASQLCDPNNQLSISSGTSQLSFQNNSCSQTLLHIKDSKSTQKLNTSIMSCDKNNHALEETKEISPTLDSPTVPSPVPAVAVPSPIPTLSSPIQDVSWSTQDVSSMIPSLPKPTPIIHKFDPSKFSRKITSDFYESMFEEKSDRYQHSSNSYPYNNGSDNDND